MIGSYLNQRATIQSRTGMDSYGKPTLSAATTINVRIQGSKKRLKSPTTGEEYIADAEAWILPSQAIQADDVIVYGSNTYRVAAVDEKVGITGATMHKKAYLVTVRR